MHRTQPPKRRAFVGGSDRVQELPEGSLPCRACGVEVSSFAAPIEALTIYGQHNSRGFGSDTSILVTRCSACADRRDAAERILLAHPAISRENGNVGLDRLDATLITIDILNRNGLTGMLTSTDAEIRELISSLAAFGGWSSWSAASAAPGVCGTRRWGHVSNSIWEDTRLAFAAFIQRRFEVLKPVTPPANAGAIRACGFCGIGSVVGKQSEQQAIWGESYRMPLTAFGGSGTEIVMAHLCPTCRPSLISSGAVGMPAVWVALIRSRGYEPRSSSGVVSLSNVLPWAALPRGAEPNDDPWAHIDMDALDRELQFTIHVRKQTAA